MKGIPQTLKSMLPSDEKRRRKRELVLIAVIFPIVILLAFVFNRSLSFSGDFPVSSQIVMFILININLLLILLLIFLVFRNLVKLLYDRKRKVMGARLRTRLVVAFVILTLLPASVLFFFSISFITSSIDFWFNVPIEQALENSLRVGHSLYDRAEQESRFLIERVAYQIERKGMLEQGPQAGLANYMQVVQREFNLDGIEVYGANADRLSASLAPVLEDGAFPEISASHLMKKPVSRGVHTISTAVGEGELLRTIGTVPFDAAPEAAKGFVAITSYISPEVAENMASIVRGYEEYQQVILLKRPIQTFYFATLSVVALLVVFCAVWLGFYVAKTITIPILRLADGTRRVAEGDLSFALDVQADDEIDYLVSAFNKMTRDLRIGREQLELSAQMLREQNIEIESRRRYMEIVLKNVSAGVITLDAEGNITTFNTSAERMLNLRAGDILKKNIKTLLTGDRLQLAEEIMGKLTSGRQEALEVPLRLTIDGRPRSFLAYINVLKDEMGQQVGVVMVIDDLTELEKAQRMAAWREVARRIAHEVKNPLTPISLSAQRLQRKFAQQVDDPVFEECTRMITTQVELIRNLVNEFSAFARFPAAEPKPCAMGPIIAEIVGLYKEGYPGLEFQVQIQDALPPMSLDRQQIKQAMLNLVDNAIAAVRMRGTIRILVSHDAILKRVRIEVADDGVGISDEDKIRLFEPNFSTKKSGMGLGLTIVHSIISDHGGTISVQDNHPQGAKFVVELPT
ncbi:sensor histidine kinase [Desulfatitalea alkaliphila]|uniref:histidine kinase n=1 Tax=Desulfatitalea alkaliphila TaxID=2929485 RepID=A0AA41R3C9_9BACT|nr:ATP-binding protein [Desulfatitalea alkaliphila]MCJ8500946.1 ATP-binding protein [Desulfatitalea alkaliphila]